MAAVVGPLVATALAGYLKASRHAKVRGAGRAISAATGAYKVAKSISSLRPKKGAPAQAPHAHGRAGEHTEKIVARREKGKGGRSRARRTRHKYRGKKKGRVAGPVKKFVNRSIKTYMKFNHGPKATVELYQKYYLNTLGNVVTTGRLAASIDEQNHAFLPLFTNSQMTKEFRINESTTGSGSLGVLDPPGQEIYSGGARTAVALNWIKASEGLMIDKLTFRLFLSNTTDTKLKLRVNEWLCNESSNINIVGRAVTLYNNQRVFDQTVGYPIAGTIASDNLMKQPPFALGQIPEFEKFWKKGGFHKTMELLPGESAEIIIPYSKIFWNQAKMLKESDSGGSEEYQAKISRFIQLTICGQVGYDATANKVSAFQATQLNFQAIKKLTAHRIDTWGRDKKAYQLNTNAVSFTYEGTAVTETQTAVTGPVKSEFYSVATVD